MEGHLIIAGCIAAIFVLFAVVYLAVSLREKQPLHVFVPVSPAERPEFSPYVQEMNQLAVQMGFVAEGTLRHCKGGTYRLLATIWLSPSRDVLAIIAGGTMARVRYRKTLLFSAASDGTVLVTADDFGEADLSETSQRDTLLNADLGELLAYHRERLAADGLEAQAFPQRSALEAYKAFETARVRRLIEMRYARYVDAGQSLWSYTLRGSVHLLASFYNDQLKKAYAQRERSKLPRPGDRNWTPSAASLNASQELQQ